MYKIQLCFLIWFRPRVSSAVHHNKVLFVLLVMLEQGGPWC